MARCFGRLVGLPVERNPVGGEGGLGMSRAVRTVVVSCVVSLGCAAMALAATPVKNGVYQDGVRGVIVGLHAKNSVHAFNVDCHGRTWVAQRFIPVTARGTFSYSGPDFLVKNRHKTSTTGKMQAS